MEDKFDIAISPVSSLWGFTTKDFRIPSAAEISATLAYSHSDQLVLSGTTVQLRDSRARIDLGGVAKGYSLDVMEEYLRNVKPQPRQVIVDFGGNLLLYSGGRKTRLEDRHTRSPWPGDHWLRSIGRCLRRDIRGL